MKQRGGNFKYFLLLLFVIIALLQLHQMRVSDRFYKSLNEIQEVIEKGKTEGKIKTAEKKAPLNSKDEGGWLIWAFQVEPATLNPISSSKDIYTVWITVPYVFEPLLTFDYDTADLKPWLAKSYEVSEDGMEISFTLRDDIYFSDGEPITAEDVIFTFNTIKDPNIDAANVAQSFYDVDRAEKINEQTVIFYMKKPYFKNLVNLSFTWDIGVMPKHVYEYEEAVEFNNRVSNPVGSGPFVFEKWDVGKQIVLKRNENYWGKKANLEKIVYKFIPNTLAQIQALRTHEVDIVIPEPEQFADLKDDEEFREKFYCLSYWTPWTPFYYIGWNSDTPFFDDRRVRLAMTHMIDREKIVNSLLKGEAEVATGPFYIKSELNDPNVKPWPYDPEKSRQLLKEAGWVDTDGDGVRDKNGRRFKFKFMYSSSSAFYERLAKFIKDAGVQVGVDVVLDPLEWSVLITRLHDRDFDSVVIGWGGEIIEDQYQIFHSSQIGRRGSNYVGFDNKRADELLETIRRTLDEDKRIELSRELHRILHREQPYTFLYTRPSFRFVDKRFKNVKIHELGLKYIQWHVPKEQQRY